MKTSVLALAAVAGLATMAQAQISMSLIRTIDTSSTAVNTNTNFVGSNVSAIAWNGSKLWVGGYNQAGSTANTAIAAFDTSTSTWGTSFGTFATANLRGMTQMAVRGNQLATALDNGAGNVNSVRSFNASTGALQWSTGGAAPDASRRGNGVAFDPGFNGAGSNQGVAYLSIGSGRRHLLDASTGGYINGQNAGAILNTTGTTWRSLAFDPATGDIYARESNRVTKSVRTGDNSVATQTFLGSLTTASTVDGQNIAFVNSAAFGNFLILNDRSAASSGQAFTSVIRAMTTSGASLTINLNGFTAANGNGQYNFSWDAASQTLAVSDFANRQVYIFAIPTPGSLALLGLGGLVAARRRRA